MKYLKRFSNIINRFKIDSICEKYNIRNYIINDDGSIDVRGDVDLSNKSLKKLPLRFNKVSGDFYCFNNKLETLVGSPKIVNGFICYNNKLKTLEGSPERTMGSFNCNYNKITTFKYFPREIGGLIYCEYNPLPKILLNNIEHIEIINSEAEDFSIWRRDGSLDERRFKYMLEILKEEGKI